MAAVVLATLFPAAALAQTPRFSEGFAAGQIAVASTTTVTFTIGNPDAPVPLNTSFDDNLPAGLEVAGTPGTTCTGGTASSPSTTEITFSDPALVDSSCTVSVDVAGSSAGAWPNPVTLNSDQGSVPAAATLNVDAPPTLAATFSPASVRLGATTQLVFTVADPDANPDGASHVRFNDSLPSGLTVETGSSSTPCGGTLTTSNPTGISFSGGALTAGQQCQFSVTVTGDRENDYTNTTGAISSDEGGTGSPAGAALTVAAPPSIAEAFGAGTIGQGATTSLTFTIANPNATATLNGIGFAASLPAALPVAAPSALANTCGGTAGAAGGGSSVSLSGGQLGPGASCTVTVRVLGAGAGHFTSTSGPVASDEGGRGNTSSASLTVIGPPGVTVSSPAPGASYQFGQKVRASYSCADDPNGPGISSCQGNVPNGALIDTSTAGLHIFTITATSQDGGNASDLVFYTVGPDSRFKILNLRARADGSVDFRVKLPGPGGVDVLETVARASAASAAKRLQPGRGQSVFARGQGQVKRAATLHLLIRPNPRGRQAVARHRRLRVSVAVRYTPKGGTPRTLRFTFRVPA